MSRLIKSAGLLILSGVLVLYARFETSRKQPVIVMDEGQVILRTWSEPYYYRRVSDNVGICDIPAYVNMLVALQTEGYMIESEIVEDGVMDFILARSEEEKYRIHYARDGYVTSIAYCYEESAIPFSYISEGEVSNIIDDEE